MNLPIVKFSVSVAKKCFVGPFFIMMLLVFTGCAHQLTVHNIDSFHVSNPTSLKAKKTIGVISSTYNISDDKMVNGVADSLRRSCEVIMPYSKDSNQNVDIIATINLQSSYDGSGVNFLISWPGFAIFAPTWNGYVYGINHTFNINLEDGKTSKSVSSFNVPVSLDIRHADFKRTFWSEGGGWLMPGMSAVALVSGFFHTSYDNDVTPLAAESSSDAVGNYVAQEIIKQININDPNGASSAKAISKEPMGEVTSVQ